MDIKEINQNQLSKKIKEIVKKYRTSMLGHFRLIDIGGRKWRIEYNLLKWKEEWKDWDFYSSGGSQTFLFEDIKDALKKFPDGIFSVNVVLICNDNENQTNILPLKDYRKEKTK